MINASNSNSAKVWLLDTGASNHVCAHDTVADTKINGTMSNAVETANGTVRSLGVLLKFVSRNWVKISI